jgi:hypothetical protein
MYAPPPTDIVIKGSDPSKADVWIKGLAPGTTVRIVGENGAVTDICIPPSPYAVNFYAGPNPPNAAPPRAADPALAQPAVVYEPLLSEAHDPCTRYRLLLNAACLLVLVAVGALQATAFAKEAGQWAILGGLCWLAYVWLSLCMSSDASALRNHMPPMALLQLTAQLRATPPVVWAEIECFHHETRTHTTHKNGKTTTRTERVKVVTHRARDTFPFARWLDTGGAPVWHPELKLLEVFFEPVLDFADADTHAAYDAWKGGFYAANTRDQEQTRTAGMAVEGYKDFVLIQQGHFLTVNIYMFAAFVVLGLGFVYELCVFSRFPHSRYKLVKQVSRR